MAALAMLGLAHPARAQQPAPPDPAWTIEGHGSVMASGSLSSGSANVPAPGATILTSSPTFPSRQAPSWLFGDGASILNGAAAALGVTSRVAPLDSAFAALGGGAGGGGGVRIARRLSSRFAAEFSLDVTSASSSAPATLQAAGAAAAASFKSTLTGVLSTGPFDGVAVNSTSTAAGGAGRDLVATGAIRWRLGAIGGWQTDAIAGGGVVRRMGSLASAAVRSQYQFSVLSQVPIDETDSVDLRYAGRVAPVGVAGAALSRSIARGWLIDVDARVLIGGSDANLLLDATPSNVTGTPAGAVESFTTPAVQFSNNPSTGRQSTLGAPGLSGFPAFSGGTAIHVLVTFGIARRF